MPVSAEYQGKGATTTRKEWDLLPEDTYQFEILDVEGYEETDTRFKREDAEGPEYRYKFTFVALTDDTFEGDLNGEQPIRGRRLWKRTSMKWAPRDGDRIPSTAWEIASAALGHDLTREECRQMDKQVNSLIGKQLRILVKQKRGGDGKVRNYPESYLAARKQLPAYHLTAAAALQGAEGDDVPF